MKTESDSRAQSRDIDDLIFQDEEPYVSER